VCDAPRPCKRRERRLIGRALAVGVRKYVGGLRCLTLRCSLPLSAWVDPHAEHISPKIIKRLVAHLGVGDGVYGLGLFGEAGKRESRSEALVVRISLRTRGNGILIYIYIYICIY